MSNLSELAKHLNLSIKNLQRIQKEGIQIETWLTTIWDLQSASDIAKRLGDDSSDYDGRKDRLIAKQWDSLIEDCKDTAPFPASKTGRSLVELIDARIWLIHQKELKNIAVPLQSKQKRWNLQDETTIEIPYNHDNLQKIQEKITQQEVLDAKYQKLKPELESYHHSDFQRTPPYINTDIENFETFVQSQKSMYQDWKEYKERSEKVDLVLEAINTDIPLVREELREREKVLEIRELLYKKYDDLEAQFHRLGFHKTYDAKERLESDYDKEMRFYKEQAKYASIVDDFQRRVNRLELGYRISKDFPLTQGISEDLENEIYFNENSQIMIDNVLKNDILPVDASKVRNMIPSKPYTEESIMGFRRDVKPLIFRARWVRYYRWIALTIALIIFVSGWQLQLHWRATELQHQNPILANNVSDLEFPYGWGDVGFWEQVLIPETIEAGRFEMGSDSGFRDEQPKHTVEIPHDFLMMKTEFPQGMVSILRKESLGEKPYHPATNLTWQESAEIANAFSKQQGLELCYVIENNTVAWPQGLDCAGWRLPTEAEWEYAITKAGIDESIEEHAWYTDNTNEVQQVGSLSPMVDKELFDVYGNVSEWMWDNYDFESYSSYAENGLMGPKNAGRLKVVRGGNISSLREELRRTARRSQSPETASSNIGFRLVRTVK